MQNVCKNCRYATTPVSGAVECRRYPPQPFQEQARVWHIRPRLSSYDYCGEFQAPDTSLIDAAKAKQDATLIKNMGLSVRTTRCLLDFSIPTLGILLGHSPGSVLRIPNLGKKSLREIEWTLKQLGLSLKTGRE